MKITKKRLEEIIHEETTSIVSEMVLREGIWSKRVARFLDVARGLRQHKRSTLSPWRSYKILLKNIRQH